MPFLMGVLLSLGAGFGFFSLISFSLLVLNGSLSRGFPFVDVLLVSLLVFFVFRVIAALHDTFNGIFQRCRRWEAVLFGFALLYGVIVLICLSMDSQHGNWDAWAIWNMRARFLFLGGEHWRDAFTPLLHWSHPDYPLLVPVTIARLWNFVGQESTIIPIVVAIGFSLCTVALLTVSVAVYRGWSAGFLAGGILLGTPYFLIRSASQYADIPIGFYYLATVFLLSVAVSVTNRRKVLVLAGMMAGCAGWTKNEGLLFMAAVVLVYGCVQFFWDERRSLTGDLLWLAGGLAPFLCTIIYFKLNLAPANDIIAGQGTATLGRLLDPSRYFIVARAFAAQLVRFGNGILIVLLLFLWLQRKRIAPGKSTYFAGGVLLVMLLGFFFVYVTTPRDLYFHLGTSLDRLLLQLWPSCLLFLFFLIKNSDTEKEYLRQK